MNHLDRFNLLADLQPSGVVLAEAYRTDMRPLLARVGADLGMPVDPLAAYRSGGYEEKIASGRRTVDSSGGYQM